MRGTIRNIRDDKDFAFIVSGANRDIFLHKNNYQGNWEELRELYRMGPVELEFEIDDGPKGLRAIKAKVVI